MPSRSAFPAAIAPRASSRPYHPLLIDCICWWFFIAPERSWRHPVFQERDNAGGAKVTSYELQVRGYRLTTAEIIYRLPDHPVLLQSFIWQKFDLAPDFPELNKFLQFWRSNIEGELHSVNVKQSSRSTANRFRHVKHSLTLH
jgi:uncharacterized protein Usg